MDEVPCDLIHGLSACVVNDEEHRNANISNLEERIDNDSDAF